MKCKFYHILHLDIHHITCAQHIWFSLSTPTVLQSPFSRIGERVNVLNTHWRSYWTWAEQGLVNSSATQTADTLLLPLSSFPGAAWEEGGEWIFSVWAAGASSACFLPPVLDLLCSDETEWKLGCSLLLWHLSVCVYVSSCNLKKKSLTLFVAVSFYLWCSSGVDKEGNACPRPVELWWEAVLALAGTGDAERGEGGPVWAGTAAPAAGGVPGRPPLLPQLPVGTDPCAELQLSAQLPTPGEPDAWRLSTHTLITCVCVSIPFFRLHTNTHIPTCMYMFIACIHKICYIMYLHSCIDTFASLLLQSIIKNDHTSHSTQDTFNLDITNTNVKSCVPV